MNHTFSAIGHWISHFCSHRSGSIATSVSSNPSSTLGSIPIEVFKAAVFMRGEKMDVERQKDIEKLGWIKARHRFPHDSEAQQRFAEKWIAEQTQILNEQKLKASDYFTKK